MVIVRATFSQAVISGFEGYGFPPEAPIIHEWPMDMFLAGSDLTPLKEGIDQIIYGLTKWQPKITKKGVLSLGEKPTVTGKDYEEALDNMNHLFLRNNWGDGLPIIPATEGRVDWILTGTDLARDALVGGGQILPKGGKTTVEALAIALAMAGGRPEYLPVLIAAVEAITFTPSGERGHIVWTSTTRSCFANVIVNGPLGKQLRFNSRYGVIGPDPLLPAGGSIGRAIAFLVRILGGNQPGVGSMAIYGFMRYTNAVFAEDEAGLLLSGWISLAVERGFKKEQNIVTVIPAMSVENTQLHQAFGPTTEDEEIQFLYRMAGDIGVPGQLGGYIADGPGFQSGLVLMGYNMAKVLSEEGWTKEKVKEFLRENATPSWDQLVRTGRVDPKAKPEPIKIAPVTLVIAGGDQSNQACYMRPHAPHSPTSAEIKLPAQAKWDALLKAAEADLGPIPV